MFAEPISVTIGEDTHALPRVTMEKFRSGWGDPSGTVSATISHSLTGNEQSQVRLDLKKVVEDPFTAGASVPVQASAWLVIRAPKNQFGFSDTELGELASALTGLVNSQDFLTHFLQKES